VPRWGDRRRIRIGLLGGSFNPAHPGHLHVARVARRRLRLDQIWLLVSPGNPLKPLAGMAPLRERLRSASGIADGRRVVATAIEARLQTRYTYDTLRALRRLFPRAQFVWVMGADNLLQLPRWQHWRGIAGLMPFAVVPRPSYNYRALAGQAAARLRPALRRPREAPGLAGLKAPAWTFLPARQNPLSATELRRGRRGTATVPAGGHRKPAQRQPALEGAPS
jgi:nicotinate-nucleotide adenylyltransferase